MEKLTAWQRKILDKLLSRYENSRTYAGDNRINQTFRIPVGDVWPGYLDDFTDVTEIEEFIKEIEQLEKAGLIFIRYKKNGEIISLEINKGSISEYYRLLNRKEKKTIIDEEIKMYQYYFGDESALGAFCRKQADLLMTGKKAQYRKDRAENYLALLKRILINEHELYERELSVSVLGDSKAFENSYRRTVCKILRDYGDYEDVLTGEDEERNIELLILEMHKIFPNPGYVYFRGEASVNLEDGTVFEISKDLPMAFSTDFLDRVIRINPKEKRVLTIENLTSFHRFTQKGFFCIYLAGYHSVRISKYLSKIAQPEEKEWLHFGDLDPDGYMILRNLRNKTGLNFRPYQMNEEMLSLYKKYSKRLEEQDKVKANTLIAESFYSNVLNYMLENDMKLEQEVIAMDIEGIY